MAASTYKIEKSLRQRFSWVARNLQWWRRDTVNPWCYARVHNVQPCGQARRSTRHCNAMLPAPDTRLLSYSSIFAGQDDYRKFVRCNINRPLELCHPLKFRNFWKSKMTDAFKIYLKWWGKDNSINLLHRLSWLRLEIKLSYDWNIVNPLIAGL